MDRDPSLELSVSATYLSEYSEQQTKTMISDTDTVALSPKMVIKKQSFGVAREAHGFGDDNIDGILGYGRPDFLINGPAPLAYSSRCSELVQLISHEVQFINTQMVYLSLSSSLRNC